MAVLNRNETVIAYFGQILFTKQYNTAELGQLISLPNSCLVN